MNAALLDVKPALTYCRAPQHCVDPVWEAAYNRFESPAEEMAKFRARFLHMGLADWPRTMRIVNLFCGAGELRVLEELGFINLEGVDLSDALLKQYDGSARLYVDDCAQLQMETASRDAVVIQGGLHHLNRLPDDLEMCVEHIHRVLTPGGRLAIVEPWLTPFLRLVHFTHRFSAPRLLYPKLDALAVMVEQEAVTYFNWLSRPNEILRILHTYFEVERQSIAWGKLMFVGRRRDAVATPA